MEERLFERLEAYDDLGIYPCHMPGHKRQPLSDSVIDSVKLDITEIDGFDNLHHPTEIIEMEEKVAAKIYGARKSFFLVNGSTSGNLSAISACVKRRGKVLVARNCHKSVYNALYLNECEVKYLIPEMIDAYGLVGGITPKSVEDALTDDQEIQAVMITSPTYDGVISDVAGIASVVHRFGIPLIVDEAHGAHFGLDDSLPKNALANGADVVIHSLHKTLPSFTQTAILHTQGDYVDDMRIARFQSMYQSTSPSYLLLSSISKCLYYVENHAKQQIRKMNEYLDEFYEKVKICKVLKVVDQQIVGQNGVYEFDRTKIVISTWNAPIGGEELYEILLHEKKLQMEMVAPEYCQAIMTFMDTKEGFQRLADAICEIDEDLQKRTDWKIQKDINLKQKETDCKSKIENDCKSQKENGCKSQKDTSHKKHETLSGISEQRKEGNLKLGNIYRKEFLPEAKYTIYEAQEKPWKWEKLEKTVGKAVADTIMLYPPGIPILAPGECVGKSHVEILSALVLRKLNVIGIEDGQIKVIVE